MPSPDLHELMRPLTPLETAELSAACQKVLTDKGQILLRRVLFELEASHRERDKLALIVRARTHREKGCLCERCVEDEYQTAKVVEELRADLAASRQQLAYHWSTTGSCPCGARAESPNTHPHVGGCPTARAIAALKGNHDAK